MVGAMDSSAARPWHSLECASPATPPSSVSTASTAATDRRGVTDYFPSLGTSDKTSYVAFGRKKKPLRGMSRRGGWLVRITPGYVTLAESYNIQE